jgi:hypothetical protein
VNCLKIKEVVGRWIDNPLSVMVPAFRGMDVCFRRSRGSKLAREHDSSTLRPLAQMFGDVRVESSDVADQALEESAGLKRAAGEITDAPEQSVQDIGSGMLVHNLLWLLFDERVVFLFEMLRKNGHGGGRHVEGAQRPPERLDGGNNFGVLTVSPIMEVRIGHHLDQVEESRGLLASEVTQAAIQFTADRAELFTKPSLLVFAAGVQISAVGRARDAGEPVFAATLAADQSVQCRARTTALSLVAIDAFAHL